MFHTVSFIFPRLYCGNVNGNICYHLPAAPNRFPLSANLQERHYLWLLSVMTLGDADRNVEVRHT